MTASRFSGSVVLGFILPVLMLSGCATFGWLGPRTSEQEAIPQPPVQTASLDPGSFGVPGVDSGIITMPAASLPPDTAMLSPQEFIQFIEKVRSEDLGSGVASYYGNAFAGRRTASGELFRPTEFTAAHRTLPFGSRVRVTNHRNGRSVVVRINDRGPFSGRRVIDLSSAAAREIGMLRSGTARVTLELLPDIADLGSAPAVD